MSATELLHEDGTSCHHHGEAQATVHDDSGPICPGGQPVTHIRFNGKLLTIAEAYTAFSSFAETFATALAPLAEAFAEFARTIGNDPHIRAMAAAAKVINDERDRG